MVGVVGCTADASTTPTGSPTPTAATGSPTATATTSPTTTRASVDVQLNPDRVTAGETSRVWILANCPVPTGGPTHVGTASSNAFLSGVTLNPVPPTTPSATPTSTAPPPAVPWVRGQAQVSGTVKRGTYTVDVKCDGTNHTGRARLRVVRAAEDTPTGLPTRAPRAGGGGMAGKEAGDDSSTPIGPVGVIVGLALAGGAVLLLKRRRA
ncbi:hypothetical protein [Nonomuraea typhae]|uniref:hypothetical protein n=1 Tax=Nonomuraea typhae TaxID=2603600 RepID=UPI0012FB94C5|nr:hypothetical protein [Nonomuraea typhae]